MSTRPAELLWKRVAHGDHTAGHVLFQVVAADGSATRLHFPGCKHGLSPKTAWMKRGRRMRGLI